MEESVPLTKYPATISGTEVPSHVGEKAPHTAKQWLRSLHERTEIRGQNGWLWETLAIGVGVIFAVAITATAKFYDSKEISAWTLGWSLNSVIALMTTVMKGAFMIPIASALSQAKWNRYQDWTLLEDFDIFDSASRGTLGSLQLLFHVLGGLSYQDALAFMGALLTVMAVFTDAFAQNVVDVQIVELNTTGEAFMPRANTYLSYAEQGASDSFAELRPSIDMITTINYGMQYYNSIWAYDNQLGTQVPFVCDSGDCDFPSFQSLSLNLTCQNVTAEIQSGPDFYSFPGPNGPLLPKTSDKDRLFFNSTASTDYPDPGRFPDLGPLLVRISMMHSDDITRFKPLAVDCVLHWGVALKTDTTVRNNSITYSRRKFWTDTSPGARTKYMQTNNITLTPPECIGNGNQSLSHGSMCQYMVSAKAHTALQNFFLSKTLGLTGQATAGLQMSYKPDNIFTLNTAIILSNAKDKLQGLITHLENIRISMDQAIVKQRYEWVGHTGWYTPGTNIYEASVYQVKDRYFLPLYSFIVLSFIFFFVNIRFANVPFKSSPLPLLFHGFAATSRSSLPEAANYREMLRVSGSVYGKLINTEEGYRVIVKP